MLEDRESHVLKGNANTWLETVPVLEMLKDWEKHIPVGLMHLDKS